MMTELDLVDGQFEPYLLLPCGVTWNAVPKQSWLLKLLLKPSYSAPYTQSAPNYLVTVTVDSKCHGQVQVTADAPG